MDAREEAVLRIVGMIAAGVFVGMIFNTVLLILFMVNTSARTRDAIAASERALRRAGRVLSEQDRCTES